MNDFLPLFRAQEQSQLGVLNIYNSSSLRHGADVFQEATCTVINEPSIQCRAETMMDRGFGFQQQGREYALSLAVENSSLGRGRLEAGHGVATGRDTEFASAARNQSRPPIALPRSSLTRRHTSASQHSIQQPQLPSTHHYRCSESQKQCFATSAAATIEPSFNADETDERGFPAESDVVANYSDEPKSTATKRRLLDDSDTTEHNQDHSEESSAISTASSFQSLILSRPTVSYFLPQSAATQTSIVSALDRAILCAQSAPNHKRTEPFVFKRILSDPAIRELAEISYQVTFRRRKDRTTALEFAERKRSKWGQVPAYVVILVENQPLQIVDEGADEDEGNLFEQLPFVPPETERQLEDYASASAAMQNLLLSLHAEQIGTKWATGPAIQTRAFRTLVKARPMDRVVGLIMVGYYPAERKPALSIQRRRRMEDLVEDL